MAKNVVIRRVMILYPKGVSVPDLINLLSFVLLTLSPSSALFEPNCRVQSSGHYRHPVAALYLRLFQNTAYSPAFELD